MVDAATIDEEIPVKVVETGVANIASMMAALRRLGATPELSTDPAAVADSPYVVLPGVGAFGAGIQMLQSGGLVEPLVERVEAGRPTLAVCLGMQLLCVSSEESPGADGLGIVDVMVQKFPANVRTPQFGWNQVEADPSSRFVETGYAYFANSYRIVDVPDEAGWRPAYSEYGGRFVAAMERGDVLACQFHPEISGPWGLELMRRWLGAGGA